PGMACMGKQMTRSTNLSKQHRLRCSRTITTHTIKCMALENDPLTIVLWCVHNGRQWYTILCQRGSEDNNPYFLCICTLMAFRRGDVKHSRTLWWRLEG